MYLSLEFALATWELIQAVLVGALTSSQRRKWPNILTMQLKKTCLMNLTGKGQNQVQAMTRITLL